MWDANNESTAGFGTGPPPRLKYLVRPSDMNGASCALASEAMRTLSPLQCDERAEEERRGETFAAASPFPFVCQLMIA